MKLLAVLAITAAVLGVTAAFKPPAARYDGFKVYKVFVKDEQQLSEYKKLANNIPVRFLNDIGGPGRNYALTIDPANNKALESHLKYHEFNYELTIDDLQEVLEQSMPVNMESKNSTMTWTAYHPLADIYDWLDSLVIDNMLTITPYIIGKTYEGRSIKAVRISTKPGNKAIFIESNIHAIEWISSATTTCFINNLLKAESAEMKELLMNYDWIYVPVLNPDGLEYTHNVERLWRKNRKPTGFSNSSGICYGTDMNRNFGFMWGGAGHNFDVPCDHWYGGAAPDTEPEVLALQHFVNSFPEGYIRMYLAFHAFGNFVLLPYGHSNTEFPPNYDQMMRIANAFADAAKVKYGTEFLSGASGLLNYPVSGSAKDWAYGVKKIPFTATIELRDDGSKYGFFLPGSQILEVCTEVTDGLVEMVRKAREEGLFN
ncbi:zinc carboxypeptidase-like [Musca vetustissima]|uniref:zinc carboxypeptidase-like n=1 Tax=Musca vetustissima TaxID=27455 RepID=UPI002AB75229|nr:zinc carboxypeptidase-like [Musca vetustissima]